MCVKKKEHCHRIHCTSVQLTIEFQSKMIFRSHTSIYFLNFDCAQRIHALADWKEIVEEPEWWLVMKTLSFAFMCTQKQFQRLLALLK
jgi:hypothetical protein